MRKTSPCGKSLPLSAVVEPFLRAVELQLRTDAIGRDEEDEQHQHAGHQHSGKVDVIVSGGIGYLVQVDGDGLQESLDLFVSIAASPHGGLSDGRRAQHGNGLQVAIEQSARYHRRHRVIKGYLGLTAAQQVVGSAFGNVEESIYLILLDGLTRGTHRREVGNDAAGLEGVQPADDTARRRRIVQIHHTDGHLHGLSLLHHGSEEQHHSHRKHHHAEKIDGVVADDVALTQGNVEKHVLYLFKYRSLGGESGWANP